MKLMMAFEFGSTGEPEISLFQRLSLLNGTKPLRLPPWPALIALQALWVLPPDPDPPDPELPDPPLPLPLLPDPDPLPPLPEPPAPVANIEVVLPPPQFAQASANPSTLPAASNFLRG